LRPETSSRREIPDTGPGRLAKAGAPAYDTSWSQVGLRGTSLYRIAGETGRMSAHHQERRRTGMNKTAHGKVRGKTIELDEDLGLAEGQEVEVRVRIVPPAKSIHPPMSEGLARVYAILGERYDSGHADTAERHNEHQP
jgi:hypothetical protein